MVVPLSCEQKILQRMTYASWNISAFILCDADIDMDLPEFVFTATKVTLKV